MAEAEAEDEVVDVEDVQLESELSNIFISEESESHIFTQGSSAIEVSEVVQSKEVEGVVTEQHLKDISQELGLIKLCWTDVPQVAFDERQHYPITYMTNNKKEKLLLWYAENFRQQINFKYPNKRPLLIACDNECGVQKMVSTTIRPTNMKFSEFQTWQGCANFVADYLTYEELESPTVLPDHINSPQTVLKRQAGHSFEYSIVLASFLIAAGYDAYVVSGYATREICRKDQSRVDCPFLQDEPEVEEEEEVMEDAKYFLKKPSELTSQFLADMEARELQKQIEAKKAQELAELEAIKEFEKPPRDDLWTWRLHSWVVVLPSKEVLAPFFIESTTGVAKSVDDLEYHGIESVWNHQNYWVLVQFDFKTENCSDISFDLNDSHKWERLLVGEPITFREMPQELLEADNEEFAKACIEAEKHLDMPSSWVDALHLSHADYERRFSKAKKVARYRKAISEQFSPYSQSDGLVERVSRYEDYDYHERRQIREKYDRRYDRMYFCEKTIADNSVLEKFERGREDALKERYYYSMDSGVEARFTLLFYHEARLDGLSKLIMDPLYLIMHFENRSDFLYYIQVNFEERANPDHPFRVISAQNGRKRTWLEWSFSGGSSRKRGREYVQSSANEMTKKHFIGLKYLSRYFLQKITEKYHRNPEKPAVKDVAMVEFLYSEKKLQLKFHYEEENVTQTQRLYVKPTFAERGARIAYDPALTSGYLTGPNVPIPKPLYLYRLELDYFKREEIAEKKTRERENELLFLLRLRAQELAAPRLIVSEFDIERNNDAKKAFQDREQERREMEARELDMVCDFLGPYYAKLGLKPKVVLSANTAQAVVEECLQDWKNLLVARANDIQQQFEQTCQEFQDRNNWYEKNQSAITKEQEEEYFEYCKRNSYYLHILEVRLNRHKEMAPQRYLAIQNYLKNDSRLAQAFKTRRRHR